MHGRRDRLPHSRSGTWVGMLILIALVERGLDNVAAGATFSQRRLADGTAVFPILAHDPTLAPGIRPGPMPPEPQPEEVPCPLPMAPQAGQPDPPLTPIPSGPPPFGEPLPQEFSGPLAPLAPEPVAALGVIVTWADEGGGVLVLAVAPFSPAADAGLLRGDRILSINQQLISAPYILAGYIQRKLPGSRIWIAYWRHGAIQSTNTFLGPAQHDNGALEKRPVPFWQTNAHPAKPPQLARRTKEILPLR